MATTNVKRWGCHHCSKRFNTISHLDRHLDIHDPNGKVKREVYIFFLIHCLTIFNRLLHTYLRIFEHFKINNKYSQMCSKLLKNRSCLPSHIHGNRESLPCDVCGRVFDFPQGLRRHIKIVHSTTKRKRISCTFPDVTKHFRVTEISRYTLIRNIPQIPSNTHAPSVGRNSKVRATWIST